MSSDASAPTLSQLKQHHKLELKRVQQEHKKTLAALKKKKAAKSVIREQRRQADEAVRLLRAQQLAAETALEEAEAPPAEVEAVAEVVEEVENTPVVSSERVDEEAERVRRKRDKARRKRERKAAKAAEQRATREAELRERASKIVDKRGMELEQLEAQLAPLGLRIEEIGSDGHCLFRAVGRQCQVLGVRSARVGVVGTTDEAVVALRAATAEYIRERVETFAPFLVDENGEMLDGAEAIEAYLQRLTSMRAPVVWGGHAELNAMAGLLERQVVVFCAGSEPMRFGEAGADKEPLRVSYHLHFFATGEHYNSLLAAQE